MPKSPVCTECYSRKEIKLWDDFRESIITGKASWGKNEILRHMQEMEREMARNLEKELKKNV